MGSNNALRNLLIGIFVTVVIIVGIPALFGKLGWAAPMVGKSWVVVLAAAFGMSVKLYASETATGEFEFYKFGYDNCVTKLGAIITAVAIQLAATEDLFPGLSQISWLPDFGRTNPTETRVIQLVVFFAVTWFVTLCAARICGDIKKQHTDSRGFLALACGFVGPLFLALYALLISSKG